MHVRLCINFMHNFITSIFLSAHARAHTQSCLSLCDPRDCSPPGSSVRWILQARILEWVACPSPPPGDLPNPGIELTSLMSPALVGWFSTTSAAWEAQYRQYTTSWKIWPRDFPGGPAVKNLPANAGDTGWISGRERSHVLRSNRAHVPELSAVAREATAWEACAPQL